MPMKCPFCGEEMTPGVIQSRDGVYWSREAGPMAALSWLNKDAITLADSGSSAFGGAAAEAFNCPRCKKNHPGLLRSPSPAIKFRIFPCKTRKLVLSYPTSTGELAGAG